MEEVINLDNINWLDTNAVWLYPVMKEYINTNSDLGMIYLSLGNLRYDEKYFVGYIHSDNSKLSIEIVSYIQYKKDYNKLSINYLEIANRYRNNGISRYMIGVFSSRVFSNYDVPILVTPLSNDGKQANLINKFEDIFNAEVIETSKRNM